VYGIVAGLKADVEKVAGQQAAAAQSSFTALVEAAGKNAPAGSGNGIDLFKAAMSTATNAFDSMQKAGRQAAETAEANFAAVTGSIAKTAGKAKRG
jgi:UDP-N-acetylmuramyl pentapeptide synthase